MATLKLMSFFADYYEQQYQERVIRNLKNQAKGLGFELIATAALQ